MCDTGLAYYEYAGIQSCQRWEVTKLATSAEHECIFDFLCFAAKYICYVSKSS